MSYTSPSRIVVGVDGSANSLAALDFAVREAMVRQQPLHLLAAYPRTPERPAKQPTGRADAGLCLTAHLRRVCAAWPGLVVTASNVTGDPAAHLIAASRTASLVVVGRGQPARPQPVGAVAAQVVAHARCPTVLVPDSSGAAEPTAVMVGLGLTPEDESALGFAFEEASVRGLPLLAVHVWSGIPAAAVGSMSPFRYDLREAQAAADQELSSVLAAWLSKYPGVRVEQMPLYDVDPVRTICDASALAGLVVVGSHRHHLRSSHVLGRTTHTLLQRITCPIVVTGADQRR